MKKIKYFLSVALAATISFAQAQQLPVVYQKGIKVSGLDVSSTAVLEQITINAAQPGKVVVRFDGIVYGSVGDRIVLAASNATSYGSNEGNVGIEARSAVFNKLPFAHDMVYDVAAGDHTFYALAHNYVEEDGDGKTSVYGSLTVTYYPNKPDGPFVENKGIAVSSQNLGNLEVLGQVTIHPTVAGKVKVTFEGDCISSPGDLIVLAASNAASWEANDGAVTTKAVSGDYNTNCFSHSRIYDVTAGDHTFYAVGQNYVNKDGDGIASIYGNLVVEFFPEAAGGVTLAHENIMETKMDLTAEKTIKSVSLNATRKGKVFVQFNGRCVSTPGDRIVLAAADVPSWGENDGSVSVQAYSTTINDQSFSHTRVYDVSAGDKTFYAVGQQYVEKGGDGMASVYGTLTATYYPDAIEEVGINEQAVSAQPLIDVYPNPAEHQVSLSFPNRIAASASIQVMDMMGRVLLRWNKQSIAEHENLHFDVTAWPAGCYLIQVQTKDQNQVQKMMKL